MNPKAAGNTPSVDPSLFLQALKEEGIDSLYLEADSSRAKPGQSGSVKEEQRTAGTNPVRQKLIQLREEVMACRLCDELASNRTHVVFGAGNVQARLVFVGEAPGRDEDKQGLPFVGRAGQLLTKIIESIGMERRDVFICNVLKCRPPQNRPPKPDEIVNCQGYLEKQIDWIRPDVICALGTFAAQTLLKTGDPISRMRGKFLEYRGIPVMCTYHPAYLLRNPAEKRKVWEDMKKVRDFLRKPTA